jgi:hypothetical protein
MTGGAGSDTVFYDDVTPIARRGLGFDRWSGSTTTPTRSS